GTHSKPEGEDRHDVGSDKGYQEKDKAGSGKGKSLHPQDDSDNYSEENLLGNNNYTELSERLAALEAQLAAEQARSAKLERESTIRDFQEFADDLYNRGSLTENLYPSTQLVELLTKLQYNEIEFSEDSSPAKEVMNLLGKLPQMVDFNDYSEDDLKPIKEDSDPLTRAVALSEEKNIEFSEAIKLVLYPQETK
ncbi:MAG: hypothetical protein R3321_00165, partial [Nitrososphaeraceae archaeon]|nr:hypothetical protein [Nitrososphaeraceae archaeon]